MRILVVMSILVLTVGIGVAAEQAPSKKTDGASVTGEINPVVKPAQKATTDKKELTWPRPHQSSETISADSIVPFPVDI